MTLVDWKDLALACTPLVTVAGFFITYRLARESERTKRREDLRAAAYGELLSAIGTQNGGDDDDAAVRAQLVYAVSRTFVLGSVDVVRALTNARAAEGEDAQRAYLILVERMRAELVPDDREKLTERDVRRVFLR